MKQKKRLLSSLRSKAVCFSIACMIFYSSFAFAYHDLCTACSGYSCMLTGVSVHNTGGVIVYDDGNTTFNSPPPLDNWNGGWNCSRTFLFTEYVGTASNITLSFAYQGGGSAPEWYTTPPTTSHDVYVFNNTTGLWYDFASNSYVAAIPAAKNIIDLDGLGFPTIYNLPSALTATPGELVFAYYQHGFTVGVDSPDIRGTVVLIPQVQKIWIEQTPICADFLGTQDNFQVHTTPELYNVLGVSGGCYKSILDNCFLDEHTIDYINLELKVTWAGNSSGPTIMAHQDWTMLGGALASNIYMTGYQWNSLLAGGTGLPDTNLHNYWIYACELQPFLSASSGYGGCTTLLSVGSDLGDIPVVTVAYNDFVIATGGGFSVSAPLNIESPPLPASSYPGNPSVPLSYFTGISPTGYETGTPWASYDMYNYTVTGFETWTATNNPMTNLTGAATNIIRIQNNLQILPGAMLHLENMKLEMGPGSHIDILETDGLLSTTPGGELMMLTNDTLTAYQGCGNDFSMWGGVRVCGNPLRPQYLLDGTSYTTTGDAQGKLIMSSCLIEYADTAVFLGSIVPTPVCSTCRYAQIGGGGGSISAYNSQFYNNNYGVVFTTYGITPPSGNYTGSINNCKFNSDNISTVANGSLVDIWGQNISGISLIADTFENNISGLTNNTWGIYADNMGFALQEYTGIIPHQTSVVSNFQCGIYHDASSVIYAPSISGTNFNNNIIGIQLSGSMGAVVVNNKFILPAPPLAITTFVTPMQSAGILLFGATNFLVHNNTLQTGTGFISGIHNYNVGIVASNVGGDDQEIFSNFYSAIETANLSNYKNRNDVAKSGLWYSCNVNYGSQTDIAVGGSNHLTDGIRTYQGEPIDIAFASGYSAANKFSAPSGLGCYSIFNDLAECEPFTYYYSSGSPASENPGHPPTTSMADITSFAVTAADNCYGISAGAQESVIWNGSTVIAPGPGTDPGTAHLDILNNISYYTINTAGTRDSLYYWVGQLQTPYGALMITNMLIEDSLLDSAYNVYNQIPANYPLDSTEYYEFVNWGSELVAVQALPLLASGVASVQFAYLGVDTTTTDSAVVAMQTSMLTDVFTNAHMWAHIRAENMLNSLNPALYNLLITATPDTILYPLPPPPPCPGVLTVTEMSNGPAAGSATTNGVGSAPASGCNYGELLVSGCGQCSSPTVNVAGWIIDDNDGSFDLAGCSVLAGVTQSHYRLSYDSIWRNVPVGSTIIVYNADSNCYSLPVSFTVVPGSGAVSAVGAVSLGNTYYVPLGSAVAYPLGTPHIQRFSYTLDSTLCNYVVDTITSGDSTYDSSYYTYGGNWGNTINFDTSGDAFQVRCPRCDRDMTTQPAFYHGFGYGTDTGTNQFASIPADSNSLGGAVIHNRGAGYKYCFTGSTAANLGDPAFWQTFAADPAGMAPPTLGNVNSEYGTAAQNNALNLPCCSPSTSHHHHHDDARTSNGNNGNNGNNPSSARNVNINGLQSGVQSLQNLSVFPSPATMTLNFQYTTQANVTIKLFDVTGRLMDEQVLQNSTAASFNVGAYAPGIYLYQVITNTNTQSGKVLIGN